jgi:hypothetical protein
MSPSLLPEEEGALSGSLFTRVFSLTATRRESLWPALLPDTG